MEVFILILYVVLVLACFMLAVFFFFLSMDEKRNNTKINVATVIFTCLFSASFYCLIVFHNNFYKTPEAENTTIVENTTTVENATTVENTEQTENSNTVETITESTNETKQEFYYLGVELIDSVTTYDIENYCFVNPQYHNTFGVVDGTDDYENITFTYLSDVELNPDVPYLLTMDNKGTLDFSDDEVVVIWEWVA